jgi:hypothetical protein
MSDPTRKRKKAEPDEKCSNPVDRRWVAISASTESPCTILAICDTALEAAEICFVDAQSTWSEESAKPNARNAVKTWSTKSLEAKLKCIRDSWSQEWQCEYHYSVESFSSKLDNPFVPYRDALYSDDDKRFLCRVERDATRASQDVAGGGTCDDLTFRAATTNEKGI